MLLSRLRAGRQDDVPRLLRNSSKVRYSVHAIGVEAGEMKTHPGLYQRRAGVVTTSGSIRVDH
ncbi:MAG: hypothetical protein J0G35_14580 [Acidobacteriales bacterium]|nr:hypothetical protein [Terriglobales bacterium]